MNSSIQEWSNKNSLRQYPLYGNCSLIPEGIITDCNLVIFASGVIPSLAIFKTTKELMSVVFCNASTGKNFAAATCFKGEDRAQPIISFSELKCVGHVQFGEQVEENQSVTLTAGEALVLPHCYVNIGAPTVESFTVEGLFKENTGLMRMSFAGDFEQETSKEIGYYGQEKTIITISLNNQSRYRDICAPPSTICDCPDIQMKQINDVLPDESGNIDIEQKSGETLLTISESLTSSSTINISLEATSTDVCGVGKAVPLTADGKFLDEE